MKLKEDNQIIDVRESPITVNYDGTDPTNIEFTGHHYMTNKFLKDNFEYLEKEMKRHQEASETKGKDLKEIVIYNIRYF